ncbi:MAG TPA: hypothetical protein VHZ78_14575 [Rhizomicrobium sp.]|jgi:hypothetical protein|nr:hypothetical protein [Rhizomicrobium sp.]
MPAPTMREQRETATPDSWKREPFTAGSPIPYEARFTAAEYARLRDGLVPHAMEDKWFVYFEAPYLFLHRSWTGKPVYRIKLEETADGALVAEALCAPDVVAQQKPDYSAALLHFFISNLLLGKAVPFPVPADLDPGKRAILQHALSGTGYRPTPFTARRWCSSGAEARRERALGQMSVGDVTFPADHTNLMSKAPFGRRGSRIEGADGPLAGRRRRGLCDAAGQAQWLPAGLLAPPPRQRGRRGGFVAGNPDRHAHAPRHL